MVDPIWNSFAEQDPTELKKVVIDVYAPQRVQFCIKDHKAGVELMAKSFIKAA